MRTPRFVLIWLVTWLAIGSARAAEPDAAPSCVTPSTVYIPIEVVTAPLGVRGETRAEYLARRYGAWRPAGEELPILETPAGDARSLPVRLPAQAGVRFERIDIVAEARLDYRDADGRRGERYGHREIGSYPLPADANGSLDVPLDVMRESGALLVIVTLRRAPDFAVPEVQVAAVPVTRDGCERRVYVPDRASAIRLNRRAADR
jgi:hypothetical protein